MPELLLYEKAKLSFILYSITNSTSISVIINIVIFRECQGAKIATTIKSTPKMILLKKRTLSFHKLLRIRVRLVSI